MRQFGASLHRRSITRYTQPKPSSFGDCHVDHQSDPSTHSILSLEHWHLVVAAYVQVIQNLSSLNSLDEYFCLFIDYLVALVCI